MEIKIVVDTNVLVSALIGKSYPHKIVYDCIFGKRITVCVSPDVFKEYESVLNRPKFARFPDFYANAGKMLTQLDEVSDFYKPTTKLAVIKDEADNRFLELALVAQANFIVTGNTNDFTFSEYEGVQIVSPKYFYDHYCH